MSLIPVSDSSFSHLQTSSTSLTITISSPQMNSTVRPSSYGLGLYTLLVLNPKENKPLLYKQVFSEGSFSVRLPQKNDQLVVYLIHNRWIGVDEEIHFGETIDPVARKKKPKSKTVNQSKTDPVQPPQPPSSTPNQDEIDLLNFISWEDEKEKEDVPNHQIRKESKVYPNLVADTPAIVNKPPVPIHNHPIPTNSSATTNNALNVDEFLSSLFH